MDYVSVDDVRAEGYSESTYSSAWVQRAIRVASKFTEVMTGMFFYKREDYSLKMDGEGSDVLFLPVPPVSEESISAVTVSGEEVDATYYEVVMPEFPDGRFNPKLRHLSSTWPEGKSNIIITGDFGFVDVDSEGAVSTPDIAQRLTMLIVRKLLPKVGDADAEKADSIIEESLKDYSYKLASTAGGGGGVFDDPKIAELVALFCGVEVFVV